MKVYLITRTFDNDQKEGVLFSDQNDALSAFNGTEKGSALAVYFTELYGEDDLKMTEIDL